MLSDQWRQKDGLIVANKRFWLFHSLSFQSRNIFTTSPSLAPNIRKQLTTSTLIGGSRESYNKEKVSQSCFVIAFNTCVDGWDHYVLCKYRVFWIARIQLKCFQEFIWFYGILQFEIVDRMIELKNAGLICRSVFTSPALGNQTLSGQSAAPHIASMYFWLGFGFSSFLGRSLPGSTNIYGAIMLNIATGETSPASLLYTFLAMLF